MIYLIISDLKGALNKVNPSVVLKHGPTPFMVNQNSSCFLKRGTLSRENPAEGLF